MQVKKKLVLLGNKWVNSLQMYHTYFGLLPLKHLMGVGAMPRFGRAWKRRFK
jgi:hypothetical protein